MSLKDIWERLFGRRRVRTETIGTPEHADDLPETTKEPGPNGPVKVENFTS